MMSELRALADSDERAQQCVMADDRGVAYLGPGVNNGSRTHDRAAADDGARACSGIDVPNRIPQLEPAHQGVFLHPGAVAKSGATVDHGVCADLRPTADANRASCSLGVRRNEERMPADLCSLIYM